MNKFLVIISLLFLFNFSLPGIQAFPQDTVSSFQQTTQADQSYDKKLLKKFEKFEKKREKEEKKEKDKDIINIDERFFLYILIDVATFLLIISLVYYPNCKQKESIFTFLMFNLLIFMLTFVLNRIKMSVGAAFGLFAVFSMLRYRTEGISMKELTYLFIFIAIGLISAIQLEFYELLIINGIIFSFTFLFDSNLIIKHEQSKNIEYENIDNIRPENYPLLLEDIRKRTGLNVHRIQVEKIDFLKDSARLKIYYYENKH
jgi:hypothetical protein